MSSLVPSFRHDAVGDYTAVRAMVPLAEESMTQIGRGPHSFDVALATVGDVSMLRVRTKPRAVGITVLHRDYMAIVVPIPWAGEFSVNGENSVPTKLYMPDEANGFYFHGERRDVLGVAIRRDTFLRTQAALLGVDVDDVDLDSRSRELPSDTMDLLRGRLLALLERACGGLSGPDLARGFEVEILEVMLEAYLCGRCDGDREPRTSQSSTQIVRKAEEHFAEACGAHVGLAGLCAAAGVGKSTLYKAFGEVCGAPPLEYFRKRRFAQARAELLRASPERGAVTRVALGNGFTELGRFSVEYRRLFGEPPAVTLARAQR